MKHLLDDHEDILKEMMSTGLSEAHVKMVWDEMRMLVMAHQVAIEKVTSGYLQQAKSNPVLNNPLGKLAFVTGVSKSLGSASLAILSTLFDSTERFRTRAAEAVASLVIDELDAMKERGIRD